MFHQDAYIGDELNNSKNNEANDEKENLDDSFEETGILAFLKTD